MLLPNVAMTIPTYPMPTLHEQTTFCRIGNLTKHTHIYTLVQYVAILNITAYNSNLHIHLNLLNRSIASPHSFRAEGTKSKI
jgi:hypothetical protein